MRVRAGRGWGTTGGGGGGMNPVLWNQSMKDTLFSQSSGWKKLDDSEFNIDDGCT